MSAITEITSIIGIVIVLVLQIVLLLRRQGGPATDFKPEFETLTRSQEKIERLIREEMARNREEAGTTGKQAREELGNSLKSGIDSLLLQLSESSKLQKGELDAFTQQLMALTQATEERHDKMRLSVEKGLKDFQDELRALLDKMKTSVEERLTQIQAESSKTARQGREEMNLALKSLSDSLVSKFDKMTSVLEQRLTAIQEDNSKKLEQMRATVDEKLHATLEKRLGESFKLVSERLELVHKGLGEMQTLASGVGDLKRVLANVKVRGTWGEVQLGNLLEQILTLDQYAKNIVTKKGEKESVEFAIKLPGPGRDPDGKGTVWLPIDAKFPLEDYQQLMEAQDQANLERSEIFSKQLETKIKAEAKDICEKYLDPPNTTDFGILFLPIEGLYAEVLRRPGLVEVLQRKFRVTVAGPTTLSAILNSLQMGFKTLAVEKRSSEVWAILGAVKTEFGRFGDILDKTQKKLQEATHTIEDASRKSRTIVRELGKVQELPASETAAMLEEPEDKYWNGK